LCHLLKVLFKLLFSPQKLSLPDLTSIQSHVQSVPQYLPWV